MMYQEHFPTILQEFEQPRVIDQNMLLNLIVDQGPRGEAGKLLLEDGIKLDEIKEIRIEFLNILKIDYLWVMPNLVKLKLSNNIIEKIEHLESLVHLKELDLSFNKIRVIENLNHLTNLEILSLYNNEISTIEGICSSSKLTVFSIGNNQVSDWQHVLYLRKFKKLRSLNIRGNPCAEKPGYFDYVVAFIPQLVYYQYRMITNKERQTAIEKNYRTLSNLEDVEIKEEEKMNAQQAYKRRITFLSSAYIECLDEDSLFVEMFINDKEGKDLSLVNDDARHAFEEYKKSFCAICRELYDLGLKEHDRRINEIELFNTTVLRGKEAAQNQGREIANEVIQKKSEALERIKRLLNNLADDVDTNTVENITREMQQVSETIRNFIATAWTKLMSNEVALHEQLDDVNEVFKINMTDMVDSFTMSVQGYFSQLRNCESEYNDTINGIVLYYLSGFGDESKIPIHLEDLCGDKDILNNSLATSHDKHLQVLDVQKDHMIKRLRNWLHEYIEKLVEGESERNREQILEISHFADCQMEELNSLQLQQEANINTNDPEIILALDN